MSQKRRAFALVVGIDAYQDSKFVLKNAVNDANAISDKLVTLGFIVTRCLNCTNEELERAIMKFGDDIKSFDIGLFYYAGHGVQLHGLNYLTSTNTRYDDQTSLKYSTIKLDAIIAYMHAAKTFINIIILDACRNNPFPSWSRDVGNNGLASIHAPKGTVIAFSTSPGETALDIGFDNNGLYTGCLLRHIDDPNIPIEEFFKRVRTSVFELSGGKQTSWEHTSLIGNFYFNSGQLIHSVNLPYTTDVIADKEFQSGNTPFDNIITGLKSYVFDKQNDALHILNRIDSADIDDSQKFLLGRNLLQTACGGSFTAEKIFKNLASWLTKYNRENDNHVLNGILFEIYFDSSGQFRQGDFKSTFIEETFSLRKNALYDQAFDFICKQIDYFSEYIFYFPSIPIKTLPIELGVQEDEVMHFEKAINVSTLISVKLEGKELLTHKITSFNDGISQTISDFLKTLSKKLCVPESLVTINVKNDLKKITRINTPYPLHLSKMNKQE